jgi:hypothetical protein
MLTMLTNQYEPTSQMVIGHFTVDEKMRIKPFWPPLEARRQPPSD